MSSARENTSMLRSTIGCIIPVRDGEMAIAGLIAELLQQTRVPDVIHVVVNNTADDTVLLASAFAGPHEIVTDLGEQFTEVFVHDIGPNSDGNVGALNYGYALVEGYEYVLAVHGDTVDDPHAVERLEADADPQNPLHSGGTTTPDRRLTLFSTTVLRAVMEANHQRTPWLRDSADMDSSLSSHHAALAETRAGDLGAGDECSAGELCAESLGRSRTGDSLLR